MSISVGLGVIVCSSLSWGLFLIWKTSSILEYRNYFLPQGSLRRYEWPFEEDKVLFVETKKENGCKKRITTTRRIKNFGILDKDAIEEW